MTPLIPQDATEKLFAAIAASGVDRSTLLAAAVVRPDGPLDYRSLCRLYEEAARLTGDPFFGLHVGEVASAQMYGSIGYIALNSATLGEALANLAEVQSIWTEAVGFEAIRRRGQISIRYWSRDPVDPELRRQESEQMLATLLTFVRVALERPVQPLEVQFEHRKPVDTGEHRRLFGSSVRFRALATELTIPACLADLPIPRADARLLKLMRRHAGEVLTGELRSEPLVSRVTADIRAAYLGSGDASIDAVASGMGVSPRTLQRRLRERGHTFQTLVDEARMEMAQRMLSDPALPLAQIAFRLGFSQVSAFHRSFRRLVGTTPRRYRQSSEARGVARSSSRS